MTRYKNVDSKLSRTGLKYQQQEEKKTRDSVAKPQVVPARKAPVESDPIQSLLANGGPVEAANVMRYDANTNENIYSHHVPMETAPAPAPRPAKRREKEVRLSD